MGLVYIAYDIMLQHIVAVKTFKRKSTSTVNLNQMRFSSESQIWLNLPGHPNVATAISALTIEGNPSLILEYVEGGSLREWIGQFRLTGNLQLIIRFAIDICRGMRHAHNHGVQAHRDLKPDNCLITSSHELKVTDFGLARSLDTVILPESPLLYNIKGFDKLEIDIGTSGAAFGTAAYMPPEQFNNAKAVNASADIYSFGIMLYEMVLGHRPFQGKTFQELYLLHKLQPVPALENLPSGIRYIVGKCLAKRPENRFSSFKEIELYLQDAYKALTNSNYAIKRTNLPSAAFLSNKGSGLSALGYHKRALEYFDRALEVDSSRKMIWTQKGIALRELNQLDEAKRCHRQALIIDPNFEIAWLNLSTVQFQAGEL